MVLYCTLALVATNLQNDTFEAQARNLLATARAQSLKASLPKNQAEAVLVDDPKSASLRYDIGDAMVLFDRETKHFKGLINRSNKEPEDTPIELENSKALVQEFYANLRTGLSLKLTSARFQQRGNCWIIDGTQQFNEVSLQEASFRAEVNRATRCIEIVDVGYRYNFPSDGKPALDRQLITCSAVSALSERTGLTDVEVLKEPEIIIFSPYLTQRASWFSSKENVLSLSKKHLDAADRREGCYVGEIWLRGLGGSGTTFRVQHDLSTGNLVTLLCLGSNSTKKSTTAWNTFGPSVTIWRGRKAVLARDASIEPTAATKGVFGETVLIRDGNRVRLFAFDPQTNRLRFREGKRLLYGRPGKSLMFTLRRR